jgi:hypothetical protein
MVAVLASDDFSAQSPRARARETHVTRIFGPSRARVPFTPHPAACQCAKAALTSAVIFVGRDFGPTALSRLGFRAPSSFFELFTGPGRP